MAGKNEFENFDALAVPLDGSNLIEASAGTGKTYSVAILVLRLILEKRFSLREILMVTFTKAAVAELEQRIRLFVHTAYRMSNSEEIDDPSISELVNHFTKKYGREEASTILKEAVVFLDETSVLTIHSFCQQTLSEFAFETSQLFGVELLQDTSVIIEEEVNKFWRKNITTIHPTLLVHLKEAGLSRSAIIDILKQHLDGKRFHKYDDFHDYRFCDNDHLDFIKEIKTLSDKEKELRKCLILHISENSRQLKEKTARDTHGKKNILHLIDEPEAFLDSIIKKRESAYIMKLFGDIVEKCDGMYKVRDEITGIIENCINQVYCLAISEVSEGIKKYKLYNNKVSFDDLIENLHTALVKKQNNILRSALQKKYKAVFIDEFQDTDRLQYEIFKEAFGKGTILFYIGDPKQSIYAWRKADIFTYFKAYNDVKHRYGMNENFRSSATLIKAMNLFFMPYKDFDTFHFAGCGQAIKYIPVNSPVNNSAGQLYVSGKQCIPVSINTQPKKESITEAVTGQVIDLLSNKEYIISRNDERRYIKPSDIGILVRQNSEGDNIKKILTKYGIPAVTIGDAKVLQSKEARALLYVLEAIIDISRSKINRALLSSFTGYTIQHILSLDAEAAIELFKKYKTNWDVDGIYTALMNFIADFGVQQSLLQNNTENGERIITNLYQLVELLYKTQTTKKLSPLDLIVWFKRGIESDDAEGDEYEQRIENDEEAVKIVTIHSSKGLQYNIVLAPFLDMNERKDDVCSFRDPGTGDYVTIKKQQLTQEEEDLYKQQMEQENRRLVYVAITRAVCKVFIYKSSSSQSRESTLTFFTNGLQYADPLLIENQQARPIPVGYFYRQSQAGSPAENGAPVKFTLLQNNWTRLSYTSLVAEMEKGIKSRSGSYIDQYDHFIFNQLVKGNKTGNMLHYIFENLHFTNRERWPVVINTAIKRFAPLYKKEYEFMLMEMLQNVLNANIRAGDISFNLTDVEYGKRVHEFEFDFPVNLFQPIELESLSDEKISINVKSHSELEGMMNGKIDMLFECKSKYFVLDWKSTFLGDSIEEYTSPALDEAMNENNYHLQYFIYTLAAKKYLQTRLPGFNYERDFGGVIYLFIRGMRKGSSNGIFNCKPSLQKLDRLERMLSQNSLV